MGSAIRPSQPSFEESATNKSDRDGTDPSLSGVSVPSWLRKDSLLIAGANAEKEQAPSTSTKQPPAVAPIRPQVLNVPLFKKHPFATYRFLHKLGQGSFAVVYRAESNLNPQETVSIKETNLKGLKKQQLEELSQEMNILSQLNHSSIVQLIAVYRIVDKAYLVMEYLSGGELMTAIARRDFYKESDARRIMLQLTNALLYMHQRGVMHRDIKPANLVLVHRGLDSPVKIVDFGFAAIENEKSERPSSFLCGTSGYMAPEVIVSRSYSTKVDIWALGVVFYIMLSGIMPFNADSLGELRSVNGDYTFPEVRFGAVSKPAKDLVKRMLTVDPRKRISAEDTLQHPWVRKAGSISQSTNEPQNVFAPIREDEAEGAGGKDNDDNNGDVDISHNLESLRGFASQLWHGFRATWQYNGRSTPEAVESLEESVPPPTRTASRKSSNNQDKKWTAADEQAIIEALQQRRIEQQEEKERLENARILSEEK